MKPFSVLLLALVLMGCGSSEEDAIAAIKKIGGTVTVDEANLRKPVTKVLLRDYEVTNSDLVHLEDRHSKGMRPRSQKASMGGREHVQERSRGLLRRRGGTRGLSLIHI